MRDGNSWIQAKPCIQAGPRTQAGPQIEIVFQKLSHFMSLFSKCLCNVNTQLSGLTCCLPSVSCNADVLIQAGPWLQAGDLTWLYWQKLMASIQGFYGSVNSSTMFNQHVSVKL